MTWTILSVGYPFAAVSEDSVGGAEQVLSSIDKALVESQHRSIVIAPAGSRNSGELVTIPPVPPAINDSIRAAVHLAVREAIERVLSTHSVDLIHLHGIDFSSYLPEAEIPVLVTLHLPISWYPPEAFTHGDHHVYFHCVSPTQHDSAPSRTRFLPPIPNGVDLDRFHPRGRKRNYALMLGRICPEKGIDIALRACRAACSPLLIGGQVYPYPEHQTYFAEKVNPLLGSRFKFLGPVAMKRKARLLAGARCLIAPSLAPETSSLVAMEALASGTPVVAFPAGALSDIVHNGRTGYLAHSEEELVESIHEVSKIDPRQCRLAAIDRFDQKKSMERYFETYRQLIGLTGSQSIT